MRSTRLIFALILCTLATPTFALPALVDAAWVEQSLNQPGIVLLDIRPAQQYQRFHIPGSVNGPFSEWQTSGKQPGERKGMMRSARDLESLIGSLGIDNQTSVVIVSTGTSAGDLAAAARVYWAFKMLGHEPVAVLDGGLLAYAQAGKGPGRLQAGSNKPEPKTFTARLHSSLLATAEGTRAALERGAEMIDARSPGEYVGLYVGDAAERPGTIPGARNLPYDWVTDQGSGKLRDPESLKQLYSALGIPLQGEQVHFCHTGNRAALTWFVSYAVLGNQKAKLYDGSMSEWARLSDSPMEQKIKLCQAC